MTKIISSLIVLCVFAIASPSYASDWQYCVISSDGEGTYYIDLDSIKITPPVVTFWYKVEHTDPLKETLKSRISINCKEETIAARDYIEYKSDGKVSRMWSLPEIVLSWSGIIPDTIMYAFQKALCADNKPRSLHESIIFIKYCSKRECSKLSRQKDQILIYDANNDLLIKGKLNASGKEEGEWTFFRVGTKDQILIYDANANVDDIPVQEVNFEDGKWNGITTFWIGKKKFSETTYKNDIQHGKKTIWWLDGTKSESFYEDGFLHGTARRYDEMGKKVSEQTYRNGELNGSFYEYFPDGKPKSKGIYINAKLYGPLIFYYENGNKKFEMNFLDGKPNGMFTHWDKNGNKIASENAPPIPEWAKEILKLLPAEAPAPASESAPEPKPIR